MENNKIENRVHHQKSADTDPGSDQNILFGCRELSVFSFCNLDGFVKSPIAGHCEERSDEAIP